MAAPPVANQRKWVHCVEDDTYWNELKEPVCWFCLQPGVPTERFGPPTMYGAQTWHTNDQVPSV